MREDTEGGKGRRHEEGGHKRREDIGGGRRKEVGGKRAGTVSPLRHPGPEQQEGQQSLWGAAVGTEHRAGGAACSHQPMAAGMEQRLGSLTIFTQDDFEGNWLLLASGGFGQVFQARHKRWHMDYAIKCSPCLLPEATRYPLTLGT